MVLRLFRNFRLLWIGQVVSVLGDGMQRIALLWWAKHAGGNGLLTAVAASSMVPLIVCSPIGGWLADRFDRRHLMICADVARMCTTATLGLLMWDGRVPAALVCALVAITATGTAVFDPSYAAAVPSLVEPEHRPAANGLNMANSAVGGLAGPLVGGVLIGVFSIGTVMIVNAVTFAWSAIFVAMSVIPKLEREQASPAVEPVDVPGGTLDSGSGPMALIFRDRALRRLVGLGSVLNLVVAPVPLLIVSLAVDRFRLGPSAYTMLAAMLSVGILGGSVSAGRLARVPLAMSMAGVGAGLVLAGILPLVGVGFALMACGVCIATVNTNVMTTFQSMVPANVQGRVFGVVGALGEGLRPLGLVLGGPLLAVLGVRWALVVVGAGVLFAALVWAAPLRSTNLESSAAVLVPSQ